MKINQWISLLSFIVLSIAGNSSLHAAAEQRHEMKEAVTPKIKTPKKGIFKKWIEDRVAKKMDKITNSNGIKSTSATALISGIISISLLLLGALTLNIFLLAIAAIMAIIGDTFSIISLVKIKRSGDPKSYKREKREAVTGLILSLLTGAIPLTILLIAIALFAL